MRIRFWLLPILSCCAFGLLTAGVAVPPPASAPAFNWPQWRGPDNDGISPEKDLPTTWAEDKNIAWTLKMPGKSGATPAIWGNRIFVTSADDNAIVVMCVSTDGKELWKSKLASGDKSFRGEGNNASPSPVTDGKHVWAFAGTGDLACFDFDGKEVWHFNTQERYVKYHTNWGMHTSPLLDGDRLYMQLLNQNGAHVIALDKATGKEVWKVEHRSDGHGENKDSYASPIIWRKGKDAYLITHGNDYAIAHRLDDGKEIWRVGGLNPKESYNSFLRFVATPVATPDLIVVPSAKHHGVVGVKPDAQGDVMPGSKYEAWRLKSGTPDVPSPLVYDGLVYLCDEDGWLVCLDAKTGAQQYRERLHAGVYRASPLAADGYIYLTAHEGLVTVVKAGPKFNRVAENKLPDDLYASPAVSNGRIYLRGWKALYAIGPAGK
jgi:outer membrane protein assembly factor BamB